MCVCVCVLRGRYYSTSAAITRVCRLLSRIHAHKSADQSKLQVRDASRQSASQMGESGVIFFHSPSNASARPLITSQVSTLAPESLIILLCTRSNQLCIDDPQREREREGERERESWIMCLG